MVLIYENETEAQAICYRLTECKEYRDLKYSTPIKKYDTDKWAVQVLEIHESELTTEELNNLVDLPADWFDPNEV